jgi:hypothetical protein
MLLATIVLLGALPQSGELARSAADVPAAVSADTRVEANDSSAPRELPPMPKPKANADADAANASNSGAASTSAGSALVTGPSAGAAAQPARVALPFQPVKPAYTRPRETRGQRVAWYTLAVAGHGAAAFDAYSTRLALAGGYGTEGNPLLRPFAHSSALYAATQVSPAVMDLLGKRMMVSQHRWVRRMWWLPQAAGSGFSIGAGAHNMSVMR